MRMEPQPFGQSHWDYLPDLVQDHILDLAARSLHRDRMKHVCLSIQRHARWRGCFHNAAKSVTSSFHPN